MRISTTLVLLSLNASLAACGSSLHSSSTSTIFDTMHVRLVDDMELGKIPTTDSLHAIAAIGSVLRYEDEGQEYVETRANCTAVALGSRRFLTNAHCRFGHEHQFAWLGFVAKASSSPRLNVTAIIDEPTMPLRLELAGEVVTGPADVAASRRGRGKVLVTNPKLDYAIIELDSAEASNGIAVTSTPVPQPGTALELLAHPSGVPLTIADECSVMAVAGALLSHDCDSLPGSSGGLIRDARTGIPLALHYKGSGFNTIGHYRANGRMESAAEVASDPKARHNEAILLSAIWKDLRDAHPDVWSAINSPGLNH